MKPLNEYPTPENDKFTNFMNGVDDASHLVALDLFARNLERRLAACRDVLACLNASQMMDQSAHAAISKTLSATAKP
jgi:hypothetical protein